MSKIIDALATVDVSDSVMQQMDVAGIYRNFSSYYKRLDDLKNFRTEFEKKNQLMRWWHNDKLDDAQLDSAEVQAEFSKTIGQLMMISIMQSKLLTEQQTQLNGQQVGLQNQADGIAEQADKLQTQHRILAEQSEKLESLVHEYFALKGLTEDGAQRLIDIATEVRSTKESMLQEFSIRTEEFAGLHSDLTVRMAASSAQLDDLIHLKIEEIRADFVNIQAENRQSLEASTSASRKEHDAAQQIVGQRVDSVVQSLREVEIRLQEKNSSLESSLYSILAKQYKEMAADRERLSKITNNLDAQSSRAADVVNEISSMKAEMASFIQEQISGKEMLRSFELNVAAKIARLRYLIGGLSVVVLSMLGGMAHFLKWI